MLIDRVMSFCDSEYRNAHRNTRCEDCLHTGDCSRNCKDCLEEIHYPSRHPNGKKFYDCPHLINLAKVDLIDRNCTLWGAPRLEVGCISLFGVQFLL